MEGAFFWSLQRNSGGDCAVSPLHASLRLTKGKRIDTFFPSHQTPLNEDYLTDDRKRAPRDAQRTVSPSAYGRH